jgi:hypothetical protein
MNFSPLFRDDQLVAVKFYPTARFRKPFNHQPEGNNLAIMLMGKAKTNNDRLVGGLGGAGGTLVLTAFFNYLLYPSSRESTWVMNLSFGIIGTLFILTAFFIHLKNRT